MDVKGIKNLAVRISNSSQLAAKNSSAEQRKAVETQAVSSAQIGKLATETEVKVEKRKPSEYSKSQERINQVISSLNVADEAAQEIDKLVKSVSGIVEQVDRPALSDTRKVALNNEAQDLVKEIKKQADVNVLSFQDTPEGVRKVEIAKKIEQTLKALFHDGANSAFGINDIKLDRKESIIQVRTNIAVARERVEHLRSQVTEAKKFVEASLTELDVAQQNAEASEVSIRQVEDALSLATTTGRFISRSPEQATAANKVGPDALRLLD